jgi:ABC-type transport system involved in multi-copper enzyme maturation permease subunit
MHTLWPLASVVIRELYRRKDFYVLFVLVALTSVLLGSVSFFNDDRIVRFVKELSLQLIWISTLVIAVTTAARQLPAERELRTIFPLLAKPVTRAQVVVGKFLGCWTASGIATGVFYLFYGVLTALRADSLGLQPLLQLVVLHWFMLGMVIALVLLGSVAFTAPSSNVTICFILIGAMMFLGRHLNKIAAGLDEPSGTIVSALYFLLPHFELFDVRDLVIHEFGLVRAGPFALALLYAAAYVALFLTGAWLVFRRQRLN